ncbi:MAG: hypothetical protein ABSB25_05860 [Sedimentisphaerales bacterium]|jgi:hypothetical protein
MTAKEPIENRLEKLGRAIGSDESLVANVMSRIDSIKVDQKKSAEFTSSSQLRSFIMNRFMRLAAAAVIAVGIIFGVKVLINDLASPAYALEQTLEACKNKQQVHFTFVQKDILKKAAWVEYDTDGNIARVRVDVGIDSNGEANQVIVWQGGHTKILDVPQKNLRLFDDEDYTARILYFVHRYDPRQAVEYIQKREQKGEVKIGIEQPPDRSKPIVVTVNYEPNTFLIDSNYPPMREVMLVDQKTKLVTAIEVWGPGKDFGHKEDEWALLGIYRYEGYDEPFEDGIFDLEDEIGEDVNIIDLKTVGAGRGLEFTEPNLTDEQKAVATVRALFEALIAKDYNEAVRLWSATDEDIPKVREKLKQLEKANINVVEIVSIGEPRFPYREWQRMVVPCTVAVEINGQRVEKKLEEVFVHRWLGHPNRRTAIINLDALIK